MPNQPDQRAADHRRAGELRQEAERVRAISMRLSLRAEAEQQKRQADELDARAAALEGRHTDLKPHASTQHWG